jgi:hypothetical protein
MRKTLSLLLLLLMLFSAFRKLGTECGGTPYCCGMCEKAMAGAMAKKDKKGESHNSCPCNTMIPVQTPVYLNPDPLTLPPVTIAAQNFLPLYCIGKLSSHSAFDWKPPKV